jgi:hypothetical protein
MSNRIGIGIDVFGAGIDVDAEALYNRIIADGGVSNLLRLNFFVKGLKAIYGSLTNVPVCYDAHWIGYKLGSGTGATAGQAAAKLYSLTVAGDAVQATAASQPLLLAHNGASSDNYWWGSGVSNNYVSTPNAVANQITDNVDLIAYINGYKASNFNYIIVKGTFAAGINYSLSVNNTGFLRFNSTLQDAVSTVVLTNQAGWIRATRQRNNGEIKFFFSLDSQTTNPQSVNWTQLGATVIGSTGALTVLTTAVNIGNFSDGIDATSFANKLYRATISNTIGGSPVADFNPASYNAATSQTAWTSTTGEIWTLNQDSTTATGYRGVLVDRVTVMSDGIDDNMTNTFSLDTVKTIYNSYTIWNELATNSLFASNNAAQVIDASMNGAIANVAQLDNAANSISVSIVGTAKLRTIRTAVINGASSFQRINNGTAATGTLGASISTSMKIMHERNGSYKSKMIYATLIVTSTADTTTQQTATFNLLKTLNRL